MYRKEHPNPQFQRKSFENLNGKWRLLIKTGAEIIEKQIEVPFCVESELSGVEYKGFIDECIYERDFVVDSLNLKEERLFLNFGAVDYEAKVYINDTYVGKHCGGYTSFSFDITDYVIEGENNIKVKVYDDIKSNVPSGKQCSEEQSYGCFYTRVTGIWQTVWLEKRPCQHVKWVKYYTDIYEGAVTVEVAVEDEGEVELFISYGDKPMGYCKQYIKAKDTTKITLEEKHLWEPGNGRLYDVTVKYGKDEVKSYFGLREVKFEGRKFLVNGKSVFQRFVLDQGYYPDGLYTAPNDEAMINDVNLGEKLGFNGARLHQKVFEPRFLYHCDRLGYMVWGEYPSWGINYDNLDALGVFLQEWTEAVERDFNHPSIILWCPLNETWKDLKDPRKIRDVRFIDAVYNTTKNIDATRPCVDVSGGFHGHYTDLYDFHCYEELSRLERYIQKLNENDELEVPLLYYEGEKSLRYNGYSPVNISEFGGFKFTESEDESNLVNTINECAVTSTEEWGYGRSARTEKEFLDRYQVLASLLLQSPKLSGFCYTQLYDIEQEQNGFYKYDRKPKFSEETMKKIAEINSQKAVVEE